MLPAFVLKNGGSEEISYQIKKTTQVSGISDVFALMPPSGARASPWEHGHLYERQASCF